MSRKIIYPGFFDPMTMGHLDLVHRATKIFDHVIIAVAKDSSKKYLFNFDERVSMIKEVFQNDSNITVEGFEGLLLHYLESNQFNVILRGLRTVTDFEYEFQMALANKNMNQQIETFFMMTDSKYSFLSSTLIREIFRLGGNISSMVPTAVFKSMQKLKGI